MTLLIIAIIFGAAGSIITYRVMKSTGQREENARALSTSENVGLRNRCLALDSVITERRVKDAYQAGYQSRESEVAGLRREVTKLREQVRLEASLDNRIKGRGDDAGGKILNISSGRG
jgi:hypothetical protein